MRLVPDNLRGRVSTTDRAAEMMIWSLLDGRGGLVAEFDHVANVNCGLRSAFGNGGSDVADTVRNAERSGCRRRTGAGQQVQGRSRCRSR